MNDTMVWRMQPRSDWNVILEMECTPRGIKRLQFKERAGHSAATSAMERHAQAFGQKHGWFWPAVAALDAYFQGEPVNFDALPVDLSDQPPFRRKVQEQCRRVGYGQTTTYADLARGVGTPAAARAVGSAMSHNPVPLVIPCHRVLRSDGGLGGFSAPNGVRFKQQLLELEGARR